MKNIIIVLIQFALLIFSAHPEWMEIEKKPETSIWASSELRENIRGKEVIYSAENLFDGDIATCWVEAAPGSGIGESFTFVVNNPVQSISIVNGFAKNQALYEKNSRAKQIKVSLIMAITAPGLVTELDFYLYMAKAYEREAVLDLKDTKEGEYFEFPFTLDEQIDFMHQVLGDFKNEFTMFYTKIMEDLGKDSGDEDIIAAYSIYCIRLEIADVYPGSKYDDTCISEIELAFY